MTFASDIGEGLDIGVDGREQKSEIRDVASGYLRSAVFWNYVHRRDGSRGIVGRMVLLGPGGSLSGGSSLGRETR